ncbi:MAG: PilZ domain-containing protein [Nitrospirae bacterium]|nr:PilZ domain-containing protein [Nitrospirota bacterium]
MERRCREICGDDVRNCFIDNQNQIDCIADMVLNKVFAVSLCIEPVLNDASEEMNRLYLKQAMHALNELTNWIKYLQVVKDIKLLAAVSEDRMSDRRRESRYPMPEIYQRHLKFQVAVSDLLIPVRLVNFSRHGLSLVIADKLSVDSSYRCMISTAQTIRKETSFNIRVRHCAGHADGFLVGAEIEDIADSLSFDFFENIVSFMDAVSDKNRSEAGE